MSQKGLAPLYLLVLLGVIAFIIIKFTSFSKPPPPSPKSLVTPQATTKEDQATASAKLDQTKLEKYLTVEAALLGVSDNISLYFKDLDHDKQVSIDPTRSWIPASTIKVFVVLEAFRQRRLGLINFDADVTIEAQNVVPTELETDEFLRLREGTKATIYQLIESMIVQSDNTAYNTLLDILDRRNINLALRNIGITETVVGEKLNLDNDQLQKDLAVLGRQPNTTTAKDLATFFDLMYNKKIADSDEILSIFKRQKINHMIPLLLPSDIVVAHKTGEWAPIFHDGGVVYKPQDPFILTVLTSSNDPKVLAKLARVAYFQSADVVGKQLTINPSQKQISHRFQGTTYLAADNSRVQVLGVSSDERFPKISAADLGITLSDLTIDKPDAKRVKNALVIPGSIFYNIKRYFEKQQLDLAQDNDQKFKIYLNLAVHRLAEVKTLTSQGNFKLADQTLNEAENNLKQALILAETDPTEHQLLQVKQVSDLHFAALSESAERLEDSEKEQFVDTVYRFYQKNHQEIAPKVQASVIANPLQQQPIIGTISEIKQNNLTLKFEDGSEKNMIVTDSTPIRGFHKESVEHVGSLKEGSRVAIVGQRDKQGKIIPTFILKELPKEFPDKSEGIVIEVNPDQNILKIQNPQGQREEVKVDETTIIKAKDTSVSLEGIKVGSNVAVFGEPVTPAKPAQVPEQKVLEKSISVKATTVTVTKNSAGKQEKVEGKPEPKKEEPKKTPESSKKEAKPSDKKK